MECGVGSTSLAWLNQMLHLMGMSQHTLSYYLSDHEILVSNQLSPYQVA
jgi:hypothetical protein